MNSLVSIKSYGFEWYTEYGLAEKLAAQRMREQGIDWAIIQNLIDPLPGSAVRQELPLPPYDDRRVRAERGGCGGGRGFRIAPDR